MLGIVDGQTVDIQHAPVHRAALGQAVPAVQLLRVLAPQGLQGGTANPLQPPGHAGPYAGDFPQLGLH